MMKAFNGTRACSGLPLRVTQRCLDRDHRHDPVCPARRSGYQTQPPFQRADPRTPAQDVALHPGVPVG